MNRSSVFLPYTIGQQVPEAHFVFQDLGRIAIAEVFQKGGLLLGVPGAFLPTSSDEIISAIRDRYSELSSLGVPTICCVAPNDPYVLKAWAKMLQIEPIITLLSDPPNFLAHAMGMIDNLDAVGLGERPSLFAVVLGENATIQCILIGPRLTFGALLFEAGKVFGGSFDIENRMDTYVDAFADRIPTLTNHLTQVFGGGDDDETGSLDGGRRWDYSQQGHDWAIAAKTPTRQSPIDINTSTNEQASPRMELVFHYDHHLTPEETLGLRMNAEDLTAVAPQTLLPGAYKSIVDKERGIYQVHGTEAENDRYNPPFMPVAPFGCLIETRDRRWSLYNIDLHMPAEHLLDGCRHVLEVQLVHQRVPSAASVSASFSEDDLPQDLDDLEAFEAKMVVSLLFEASDNAPESPLDRILENEICEFKPGSPPNLQDLIEQADDDFIVYDGSATRPPCQENYTWYVARRPLLVRTALLKILRGRLGVGNYREQQASQPVRSATTSIQ
ncbi:MAG: uncharacterized protein KVP18_002643 [Porospora cf. gigantea A]|uniref:uncharacterized protein n=1 Tax=Porospora cf. gigantea A TaxID=2853593 RepID=UPI00355A4E8F|nr:MAG: hypothetical protein KVP18_002643 [Porospora cf. gigantea A]